METTYLILEDPTNYISHVPAALHIRATATPTERPQRNPTHFVLVIDTSSSMEYNSRLENVKHSASLVLNFLGPNDRVSLITFGQESTVHCKSVPCGSEQKTVIQGLLNNIIPYGCTNLSAGILNLKTVITDTTIKTGVLLLTDGHANRGVFAADKILDMFNGIHAQFPAVSFTVVGYGTDHNAELMKAIAENTSGAYSIVEGIEGAASVIGNTIGGLFSCSSQVVRLKCRAGTVGVGVAANATGFIEIGDVYDESEQIILFNIPKEALGESIQLTGSTLPSMDSFSYDVVPKQWTQGQTGPLYIAADLTRLRYTCSDLFKKLAQRENIDAELAYFRARIFAIAYDGNPVAEMLRSECASLENAARANVNVAHLYQHMAFNTLGRGTTQTIQPDDPGEPEVMFSSPASSRLQRRVTNLMSSMTGGGAEAAEAAVEAAGVSQM